MFEIKIIDEFSSAHRLRGYKGKCENLHGHNWKVEVVIEGENLDETGLLIDFGILRKKLKEVLNKIDHKNLNSIPFFRKNNPTSENIAVYIYKNLIKILKNEELRIKEIVVWENEKQSATFKPKPGLENQVLQKKGRGEDERNN